MSKKSSASSGIDINIKELGYTKLDGFQFSKLELELSGRDMNNVIANTLRRISYDDIPTYAFEYVNIEQNTSKAFDNDMMRTRLRQLPLYNISNPIIFLHPKYWVDVDYYDKAREKHPEEKSIEMIVNAVNNTPEIMSVTTNEAKYYVEGELSTYPHDKHNPILLIDLKPGQVFKCQMKACLGVGERDVIWYGSKDTYYEYADETPNTIKFTIEGNRQIPEYEVLVKSCKVIRLKLNGIREEIDRRIKTKEILKAPTINFELVNEDHTFGNLINNAFQAHPQIAFSGLYKPDHLVRMIGLKIQCMGELETPFEPMFEVLGYLDEVFNVLEKKFASMGKVELD